LDKFLSDHWAIMAEIDWNGKLEEVLREKIDWDILGGELHMAEEDEEKGDFHWYDQLKGNTPYEKLKLLRQACSSTMRITEKSKRWWDEELSEQLKITTDARRGKGSNRSLDQASRIKRWKTEKDKIGTLVREKKKECWQAFCEENGEKDPWEIVKWAKDPWHLKTTMGDLTDTTGVPLKTDSEKKNGLIRDHFGWRNDGRKVDEMEEERERYPGTGIDQEKMEELVRKALAGTSNRSAPRPDRIGYKLIKRVLDFKLGSELIREVAENLIKGRIPKEWQHSKVVMIPKPGKDHSKTKGWRPINLINCIGKLGEKVVADRLQESGLLHRHHFGSVKGRSATEAALRVVTRAQRCMAAEGAVGWNFWDVKGGF